MAVELTTVWQAETLDDLWAQAEKLGAVDVDPSWTTPRTYRVRIRFSTPRGSMIFATGNNASIHFALADAINEARDLGAK